MCLTTSCCFLSIGCIVPTLHIRCSLQCVGTLTLWQNDSLAPVMLNWVCFDYYLFWLNFSLILCYFLFKIICFYSTIIIITTSKNYNCTRWMVEQHWCCFARNRCCSCSGCCFCAPSCCCSWCWNIDVWKRKRIHQHQNRTNSCESNRIHRGCTQLWSKIIYSVCVFFFLVFDIWYLIFEFDIWYLNLIFDIWYLIFDFLIF